MPRNDFSEAYKIQCRAVWYDNGCPSVPRTIEMNILPADEHGITVGHTSLRHWMEEGWLQWRDVMNAEVATQSERVIVQNRIALIEKQLNQNVSIADKAYAQTMREPFDSSAAANQAFYRSSAEVRGLMQVQKVIEDMTRLETGDIKQKIKELTERGSATVSDIIEVIEAEEKEEVAEPLD